MKTRTGFVSNSSSSSFVILGVDLRDEVMFAQLQPFFERESDEEDDCHWGNWNLPEGYDYISDDPDGYVGIILGQGGDGYLEGSTKSISELVSLAQKMSEELEIPLDAIKLICGERSC